MLRYAVVAACCVVLTLLGSRDVGAQEPVPRINDAELVFEQGLEAFEDGDYGMAHRRFRLVYSTYQLNRKTTAALLMAGKSLYRAGQFQEAVDLLNTLIRRYPTSSYLDEARRVIDFALQRQDRSDRVGAVQKLGIVLPLQGEDATLTQALFTGIRIAVEEHNRLNNVPVRMIFRDSRAETQRAASSVSELADLGVEAIIGPLYSREAMAAAEAAERASVVLIPPLANDESVSDGRRFVFQANPTITVRGRLMARFALRGLMMDEFGIIAERDPDAISERMAEGFQEEVMLQGGELTFYELLESRSDWGALGDLIGADTLRAVEAVYVPLAGGGAINRIDAVFTSLERVDASRVRVLGNTEWHDLPHPNRASQFGTTYSTDFYVDQSDESVQAFMRQFRDVTGRNADPSSTTGRLAFTGYDVTRYVLAQARSTRSGTLREQLLEAPMYQGLGLRIDFRGGNVNQALYYFRYQDGAARLLR